MGYHCNTELINVICISLVKSNAYSKCHSFSDDALFRKILYDKAHVLHSFLPDRSDTVYSLRARSHNKSLVCKTSDLNERYYLVRVIYKDCY